MKIYYEGILVGEVLTNQSLTVDQALALVNFDEQEFCEKNDFDSVDFNNFELDCTTK